MSRPKAPTPIDHPRRLQHVQALAKNMDGAPYQFSRTLSKRMPPEIAKPISKTAPATAPSLFLESPMLHPSDVQIYLRD